MTETPHTGTARVKRGLADMLKGGVIMDVVTPEQAKIAEDAGASSCHPCGEGYFNPALGQLSCLKCSSEIVSRPRRIRNLS